MTPLQLYLAAGAVALFAIRIAARRFDRRMILRWRREQADAARDRHYARSDFRSGL